MRRPRFSRVMGSKSLLLWSTHDEIEHLESTKRNICQKEKKKKKMSCDFASREIMTVPRLCKVDCYFSNM